MSDKFVGIDYADIESRTVAHLVKRGENGEGRPDIVFRDGICCANCHGEGEREVPPNVPNVDVIRVCERSNFYRAVGRPYTIVCSICGGTGVPQDKLELE